MRRGMVVLKKLETWFAVDYLAGLGARTQFVCGQKNLGSDQTSRYWLYHQYLQSIARREPFT